MTTIPSEMAVTHAVIVVKLAFASHQHTTNMTYKGCSGLEKKSDDNVRLPNGSYPGNLKSNIRFVSFLEAVEQNKNNNTSLILPTHCAQKPLLGLCEDNKASFYPNWAAPYHIGSNYCYSISGL